MLTLAGGILGVLMMVPLRRALIVKEHGVLPYPEGTACAEVLVAGERGGKLAAMVFGGLGIGAFWKALSWIFNLFRTEIGYSTPRTSQFPNATLNVDISPEYLGVGYVIGPRIAGTMFAGGVLSWLVLLPLLSILGSYITEPFPPIHPNFAKQPGDGPAVPDLGDGSRAALERLHPLHRRRRRAGVGPHHAGADHPDDRLVGPRQPQGLRRRPAAGGEQVRTERDIPMAVVLGGSLLLAVFLAVTPGLPTQGNVLAAVLILVFGFFFATVSSRITGLIGSSSNPISGMTIATLILTCLLFVALGWTGDMYAPIALCVGAIVCIAAANAGNTSQDLKTGYIVGATPLYQQIGLVIGVLVSALVIGITTLYMHQVFGIGSAGRAGAAGHADGHDHHGPAQPEPAVGAGAGRRVRLGHARAVRHPLAVVRGGLLSAHRHHGADLRGRPGALVGRAEDRRRTGIRRQLRHALQLRPDCRRVDRRN